MSDLPEKKIRYGGTVTELTKQAALPLHLGDRTSAAIVIAEATGQKFHIRPSQP